MDFTTIKIANDLVKETLVLSPEEQKNRTNTMQNLQQQKQLRSHCPLITAPLYGLLRAGDKAKLAAIFYRVFTHQSSEVGPVRKLKLREVK